MVFRLFLLSTIFLLSSLSVLYSQSDDLHFEQQSEFEYSGFFFAYSGTFDVQNADFIYAASHDLGLVIFEISEDGILSAIDTIAVSQFNNLQVSNVYQESEYLYVSIGGFQGGNNHAGLAVLDVSDPKNVVILSIWESDLFDKGNAIVKVQGDYAYLGLMDEGLVILDIADKTNIQLLSQLIPDVNFPTVPGIFSNPHTRGLAVAGDYVYLCHDAGGFRVIDISDISAPVEIAKYVNEYIDNNAARAYNNVLIDGDLAYIAVDYCGLEVVDISNPSAPSPISLYNPWDCGPTNWENGEGHASELVKADNEAILFLSAGDTELLAFDISNPLQLREIGRFGEEADSAAAWGLNISGHRIALFYIDNSIIPDWIPQPFYSDFGGVKLLEWGGGPTATKEASGDFQIAVQPNPSSDHFLIRFDLSEKTELELQLFDPLGQSIRSLPSRVYTAGSHQIDLDISNFPMGLYILSFRGAENSQTIKLIKS